MKEEFIELLKSTNREGMDKLLAWIEKSDFYKAPASTRFHGSYEGGLLEHSLNVYKVLKQKLTQFPFASILNINDDTLIIITLLHDICKANYYCVEMRNKKNEDGIITNRDRIRNMLAKIILIKKYNSPLSIYDINVAYYS